MQNTKRYLVIGSSAAGIAAATKLRTCDPQGSITCITAEKGMPYNRCLLADYLAGSRPTHEVMTRDADFFAKKNITFSFNSRVVAINAANKKVTLNNGTEHAYDKLFLGIGKSAWVPPITGKDAQGVVPFFDLKDAQYILDYLKNNTVTETVVVGAGLTGLECADALNSLGLKVTVVECNNQVLNQQIDTNGSAFIEKLMLKNNVTLLKNSTIKTILSENNMATSVTLSNDQTIPCQLVVLATGGRPNLALIKQAGLEYTDLGVVVDEHMQTSDEHIFAGGDICQVKNQVDDSFIANSLWPDAVMQGMVAATNMVTPQKRSYPGLIPITSSTIFETTFVTSGPVTHPDPTLKSLYKKDTDFYHRLLFKDNMLKGFVMVGNILQVGSLRRALITKSSDEQKKDITNP